MKTIDRYVCEKKRITVWKDGWKQRGCALLTSASHPENANSNLCKVVFFSETIQTPTLHILCSQCFRLATITPSVYLQPHLLWTMRNLYIQAVPGLRTPDSRTTHSYERALGKPITKYYTKLLSHTAVRNNERALLCGVYQKHSAYKAIRWLMNT